MTTRLTLRDGTVVQLGSHLRPRDGRLVVDWCSHWERIYDVAAEGHVERVFHPGHGDPVAQFDEFYVV